MSVLGMSNCIHIEYKNNRSLHELCLHLYTNISTSEVEVTADLYVSTVYIDIFNTRPSWKQHPDCSLLDKVTQQYRKHSNTFAEASTC